MKTRFKKSANSILLLLFAFAASKSYSGQNDYDGKWNAIINCGVNSLNGRPGFTNNTDFNIASGKINETKVASTQLGKDENAWSGQIQNGKMTLNAAGKRDNGGSWEWKFTGKATSNESIALDGAMLADGKQIRDCSIKMSLTAPAASNLVAKVNDTSKTSGSEVKAQVIASQTNLSVVQTGKSEENKEAAATLPKKDALSLLKAAGGGLLSTKNPSLNVSSGGGVEKPTKTTRNSRADLSSKKNNFEHVSQALFDLSIVLYEARNQNDRIENAIIAVNSNNGLARRFADVYHLTSDFEKKLGGWLDKYPSREGGNPERKIFYRILPKNISLPPQEEEELFELVREKHDALKVCLLRHYIKYTELKEKIDDIEEPRREQYKEIVRKFDRLTSYEKTKKQFPNPDAQPDLVAPLEELLQSNTAIWQCGDSATKIMLRFK